MKKMFLVFLIIVAVAAALLTALYLYFQDHVHDRDGPVTAPTGLADWQTVLDRSAGSYRLGISSSSASTYTKQAADTQPSVTSPEYYNVSPGEDINDGLYTVLDCSDSSLTLSTNSMEYTDGSSGPATRFVLPAGQKTTLYLYGVTDVSIKKEITYKGRNISFDRLRSETLAFDVYKCGYVVNSAVVREVDDSPQYELELDFGQNECFRLIIAPKDLTKRLTYGAPETYTDKSGNHNIYTDLSGRTITVWNSGNMFCHLIKDGPADSAYMVKVQDSICYSCADS